MNKIFFIIIGAMMLFCIVCVVRLYMMGNETKAENTSMTADFEHVTTDEGERAEDELSIGTDFFIPTKTKEPITEGGTSVPPSAIQNPEIWGEIVIDGKSINVGNSVDESALDKRPGWMDTSALPGEGTTVILGHRNNSHLRVLENAEIEDVISLNVGGVSHSYTISEINIHEDSNYIIPATEGNALVLVTCYPFRYSGNAPGKAVVICE